MPEECASGTDALTQPGPDYVLDLLWPSTRVEYWCKNFIGYTVKSLCIQTIPWVMWDKRTKLWKLHIWINIYASERKMHVKHFRLSIFGPNTRYHSNQQCYLAVASFFILLHFFCVKLWVKRQAELFTDMSHLLFWGGCNPLFYRWCSVAAKSGGGEREGSLK